MRQPLFSWLGDVCGSNWDPSEHWTTLCQMLKIDYTGRDPQSVIQAAANADNDLLLDLIDARLSWGAIGFDQLDSLRLTLVLAGSGWQVNDSSDGLEQVVDETVRATAVTAIHEGEKSASQHLANAWSETFGRDKNPTQAHGEMIRAVESAARPVVTPKDLKATLGTIIGQMDNQSSLYTTAGVSAANDGVEAIVAMMKILWQQQTDRHGANPTIPATQERVEFLLPIAAALVHAFSTGAVRRLP